MSPHIEEAWRALGLADRDIHAFHVLKNDPECHLSVVCFHAHQAIEKALKAVLFSRRIEFKRTHNLTELTSLTAPEGARNPGFRCSTAVAQSFCGHLSLRRDGHRIG